MEFRDDQPTVHEIGNRTYIVADVDPLDVDGIRTVEVGTALWLLGVLGLLHMSNLSEALARHVAGQHRRYTRLS